MKPSEITRVQVSCKCNTCSPKLKIAN